MVRRDRGRGELRLGCNTRELKKNPTFEKMGRIVELWVLSIFECMILWRSRNKGAEFRGKEDPIFQWWTGC